ncbi:MAG: tRNA(Met) cytidine acetyltransferase TmcA [Psychrobium sp.]
MSTLSQSLQQLSEQYSRTKTRQFVVLSGEQAWACDLVKQVVTLDDCLWIGAGDDAGVASTKAHLSLGREYQSLVFNAFSGFHPDAFGQAIGALNGGGICYLLVPEWAEWQSYQDPDYQRYVATPDDMHRVNSLFIQRLQREIEHDGHAIVIKQGQSDAVVWQSPLRANVNEATDNKATVNKVTGPYATVEQAECVAQIIKVATGHRNRPLVINADRGRGKSSALGIAAAQLLQNGLSNIVITAPKAAALDSVFFHAMRLLPDGKRVQNSLLWQDKQLRFVAPDELVSQLPEAELVMVDEAAAIPTPMLLSLSQHYSRLVFSTTIHGYEGTGRGFVLKFLTELEKIAPQMRQYQLSEPVRWQLGDPVEALSNKLLGINAKAVNLDSCYEVSASQLEFKWLTQSQLAQDSQLLEQLFGLLVLAHYQTSPTDFRQLLDAPDLHILVGLFNGNVVAASLIMQEGNLPAELVNKIALSERRLRGHLLPQSLLGQLGVKDAASFSYGRIMRIAVHPQWQGSGIGCALDEHTTQWANAHNIDILGSSFGATAQLSQFWFNCDYRPVRLGFSRDSASGTHSLMVLKAINNETEGMIATANEQFSQALRYDLADSHSQLSSQLVVKLLQYCKELTTLGDFERFNIENYCRGNRPVEQVNSMIEKGIFSKPATISKLGEQEQALVIKRILQRHSWASVCSELQFTGKKQAQQTLRCAISSWFQHI